MSKLEDSIMKSINKLLERAFRYKYLTTKYKQDYRAEYDGKI